MAGKVNVRLRDPRAHYSPAEGVTLKGTETAEVPLSKKVKSALEGGILVKVAADEPRLLKAGESGLASPEPAKTNNPK